MNFPEIPKQGITALTKTNCINCEKLKGYLFNNNMEYKTINCDEYYKTDESTKQLRQHLITLTGKTNNTYPMVF